MVDRNSSGGWVRNTLEVPEGYVDTHGYADMLGISYQAMRHGVAIRTAQAEGAEVAASINYGASRRAAERLVSPSAIVGTVRLWKVADINKAERKIQKQAEKKVAASS